MKYEELKAKVEGLIEQHRAAVKEMAEYAEACRVQHMIEHLFTAEVYKDLAISETGRAYGEGDITRKQYDDITDFYDSAMADYTKIIVEKLNKNCKCHLSID